MILLLVFLIGVLQCCEARLLGHPHRNGAMSSVNIFLAHLRSLIDEPDPDGSENGLGQYTIAIIVVSCSIAGVACIAWIVYRYKQWVPKTKRRGSKSSSGPESDQLIPPAVASVSPVGSTIVTPDSASPSNIFTKK
jgi:hypothetical protein